jgi:ribosomal protein L17
MTMKSSMLPEFPRLQGEEAIETLQNFIKLLAEKGNKDLTKKQTKTLKKVAEGLITSSIETEWMKSRKSKKRGLLIEKFF